MITNKLARDLSVIYNLDQQKAEYDRWRMENNPNYRNFINQAKDIQDREANKRKEIVDK